MICRDKSDDPELITAAEYILRLFFYLYLLYGLWLLEGEFVAAKE